MTGCRGRMVAALRAIEGSLTYIEDVIGELGAEERARIARMLEVGTRIAEALKRGECREEYLEEFRGATEGSSIWSTYMLLVEMGEEAGVRGLYKASEDEWVDDTLVKFQRYYKGLMSREE